MNAEYNQTELFDRYLENRLTPKEMKDFEDRLKIDPDFSESFRLHKEIDFALLEKEIQFFREELDKIHEECALDEIGSAPMLISDEDEPSLLDKAIMEEDVLSLRNQLDQIHSDMDFEITEEEIAKYADVERAVLDQDSVKLHVELDKFDAKSEYPITPDFAERELLENAVDQAIMESDVINLRSRITAIGNELVPNTKVIPLRAKVSRVVAAAAVLLILVSSGLFMGQRIGPESWLDRNLDKIGAEEVGPGPARGVDDVTDPMITIAYKDFLNKEYNHALEIYGVVELDGKDVPSTWIYQGIANYELGNYSKASEYFMKVIGNDDNTHIEAAEWNLAKCFIREKKINEAKDLLNSILALDQHDYLSESKKLIKKLK